MRLCQPSKTASLDLSTASESGTKHTPLSTQRLEPTRIEFALVVSCRVRQRSCGPDRHLGSVLSVLIATDVPTVIGELAISSASLAESHFGVVVTARDVETHKVTVCGRLRPSPRRREVPSRLDGERESR